MEIQASSKHLRQSPKKMRQVIDLVRGKNVHEALKMLGFTNEKAAGFVKKTLQSAIANMLSQEKPGDIDNLYIKTITVDGGPVFKRWRPAAYGRATPRLKRTSHLTVILSNQKN